MTRERWKFSSQCLCCDLASSTSAVSRRGFVAGATALGASAVTGISFALKAQAQAKPHRIDVHHHISPPTWLDAMKKAKLDNPPMANWSVQKTLDDMDMGGVATSITSPTTPQVTPLDQADATRIAREVE